MTSRRPEEARPDGAEVPPIVVPLTVDRSLHPAEPLGLGLVRLQIADLETARAGITPPAGDEGIHEARKALKRFRARVRLVRAGLTPDERQRLLRPAREVARSVASARDATVRASTIRELAARYGIASEVLVRWGRALDTAGRGENDIDATASLETLRNDVRILEHLDDDWAVITPGLARLYRRGRRARRGLGDADSFHEWRKRVKDLRTAFETLRSLWPPLMAAQEGAFHDLGHVLGRAHDRAHLLEVLPAVEGLPDPDRRLLRAVADDDRRRLETLAADQGTIVFAEPTGVMLSRLGAYWAAARG